MTKRLIKTLPINGVGIDIDLTNYHPIVEHPKFRRLGRVQQVPLATDIYEGCTHTRREHCIGSFYFASQISERDEVELTDQEKIDYVVSALIHDVGHGPFSHVIENVTRPEMEHDEINIEIAREMSRELKECGADPDNVVEIMSKKSDISPMVGSVLGAEKLDYVSMDLYHCGLGTVPAIERLITSAVFRGDGTRKYGIEYENHGGSSVVNFLKAWWDGHTNIYLHRDVEIPRVMLQRAVGYEFTPDQYKRLFEMDDYELMAHLRGSDNEETQRLMNNILNGRYHQQVAVLKLDGYEDYEDGENVEVYTATTSEMETFQPDSYVRKKESEITSELELPTGSIIIANSQDIQRIDPENQKKGKQVNIVMDGKFRPLTEVYPDFVRYLTEEKRRHYGLRIIVDIDHVDDFKRKTKGTNLKKLMI